MRILVIVLLIINLLVFGIGTYFDDIRHYVGHYVDHIQHYIESYTTQKTDEVTIPDAPIISDETSETTPDEEIASETDTASLPAEVIQTTPVQRLACIEIGPISTIHIPELKKIIGTLPTDTTIEIYPQSSNSGLYWVYLPAAETLAKQQEQIAILKSQGIQDYFIVQTDSQGKGAVSLGVFRSQTLAQNLQTKMVAKGIPAQIGQRETDMSYLRITQAPETIKNKYPLIRQKFPAAYATETCQS